MEKNDKIPQVMLPKFKERLGAPGYRWEYNANEKTIFIRCGGGQYNWSEIVFKSEEAAKSGTRGSYEGSKIARLGFDEEPSEHIFDQASVRTIDLKAQILVAATMWEEGISWLYDRLILPVIEGQKSAADIELVGKDLPMESNPMLDPKEIQAQRERVALRSPEESAVRFDGKYIPVSGQTPWSLRALDEYAKKEVPYKEVEL